MEMTRAQKKILIAVGIGIALFGMFWVFIYLPAKNSVEALRQELLQIENEINATKAIIDGRPLGEGIVVLQKRLEELDKKLPRSEEETLRMISSVAYSAGVNVASTKPQSKSMFLDDNQNIVNIENKFCQKMPVSMSMRATYRRLGVFLESLRKEVPDLSTVEKVTMTKRPEQHELDVDIEFTIYLLCEGRR